MKPADGLGGVQQTWHNALGERNRKTGNRNPTGKNRRRKRLTFVRRVPSLLLRLPPMGCICGLDDVDERGATGRLVPTPTAGETERAGTFGGRPSSMPG